MGGDVFLATSVFDRPSGPAPRNPLPYLGRCIFFREIRVTRILAKAFEQRVDCHERQAVVPLAVGTLASSSESVRAEGSVRKIQEYQTIRALPHNPGVGNWRALGSHSQRSG